VTFLILKSIKDWLKNPVIQKVRDKLQ